MLIITVFTYVLLLHVLRMIHKNMLWAYVPVISPMYFYSVVYISNFAKTVISIQILRMLYSLVFWYCRYNL
jgi:hypothetical protein